MEGLEKLHMVFQRKKNDPPENANLKQMLLWKSILSTIKVSSFKVFIFASLKDDTLDSVALVL